MRISPLYILSFLLVTSGCIEPFTFDSDNEQQALVVEGFISDISYNDSEALPMNPRFFEVRLKMTSVVSNVRDIPVTFAEVKLVDDLDNCWEYTDFSDNLRPGVYVLMDTNFKVEADRQYQLRVWLGDGRYYESSFESVPLPAPDGIIISEQTVEQQYLEDETSISSVDGLSLKFRLNNGIGTDESYNIWSFTTTYGFLALDNPSSASPVRKCWMTTIYDHPQTTLTDRMQAELDYELLFFDVGHQWLPEGISLLIDQRSVSESYYQFRTDLQAQEAQAKLFAPPPYNSFTNLYPVGHNSPVFGFFEVSNQKVHRWIFRPEMLDYGIPYPQWMREGCGPMPPPECFDCTQATPPPGGSLTNIKPEWWTE